MRSEYATGRAHKDQDREGWLWVEFMWDGGIYWDPPEAPEYGWYALSPKLRLFDYPGGPARGQMSKEDYKWLDIKDSP